MSRISFITKVQLPLLFLLLSFAVKSQTVSFRFAELGTNAVVSNNRIYYEKTEPWRYTENAFKVTNTSATTQTIELRRSKIKMHNVGPGDSAFVEFCIDASCFASTTNTTSIVLAPGQDSFVFLYIFEATVITESIISYRFCNANNPNDAVSFLIKYNSKDAPVVSLSENDPVNFLSVYPNPVSPGAEIRIANPAQNDANLTLTNSLGAIVFSKPVSQLQRDNNSVNIDTSDLGAGVYFVTLVENGSTTTGKFIVLK